MEKRRKIFVGFLIAIILLALLIYGVGWKSLLGTLVKVNFIWIIFSLILTFICLFLWSMSWRNIISCVGKKIKARDIFPLFLSGVFANNITPLGQAGGEAAIAYILSSKSDIDYEECFATILVTDIINLLPFLIFSIFGILLIVLRFEIGENILLMGSGGIALSIGVLLFFYVLLTKRLFFEKIVLSITSRIAKVINTISPKWRKKLKREKVEEKIAGFYKSFSMMKENKTNLMKSLFYSFLGWIFMVFAVRYIFIALGQNLSILIALFIVALTSVVSFTPLPGGTGGVEITITLFLSTLIGLSLSISSSIAILFRFVTYWIPLIIGGLISISLLKSKKINYSLLKD